MDILKCLDKIRGETFSLHEVYAFVDELSCKHPDNCNVEAKIRQQLQFLRNRGFIEFLGEETIENVRGFKYSWPYVNVRFFAKMKTVLLPSALINYHRHQNNKNRGGLQMEKIVEDFLKESGAEYYPQMYLEDIEKRWRLDLSPISSGGTSTKNSTSLWKVRITFTR